ncbi:MAG TPA: amidohydrolase family protein [Planctomycetota bacterium]|nr:amidohydrolase family protein [Planctomycetota bacterium]
MLRSIVRLGGAAALLCGVGASLAPAASASSMFQEPAAAPKDGEKPADKSAEDKKKEEKEEWFALTNGDVFTGTGSLLRGMTVLAKNGVITEIASEVDIPEGAKILDAKGMRIYPGLVAISSSGLLGGTSSELEDTVDPFNSRMVLGLASGITSTGVGSVAAKLKRGEIKGVVMRDKYSTTLSYSTSNPSSKRSLVEKLDATSKYLRDFREYEAKKSSNKELKEPAKKGVDSAVLSVLKGETLARFNADSREDLIGIARIAQKYGFRPVIDGCSEGWTVADELGRAGAFAILTPRDRNDKSEALVRPGGTSIENAAILHAHGVQVAIIPATRSVDLGGIAGRDIIHLPIEADFAVRGGLPESAAIAAITIVPARILGVDHRVGTIEVGKDCDLLVMDGDLLHYQTFVQYAIVDGKQVYDKEAELWFAHIRPRTTPSMAPETRTDAGEEIDPNAAPKPEAPKEGLKPDETKPEEKQPGDGETPPEKKPEEPPKETGGDDGR